jgi:hypothetical protein
LKNEQQTSPTFRVQDFLQFVDFFAELAKPLERFFLAVSACIVRINFDSLILWPGQTVTAGDFIFEMGACSSPTTKLSSRHHLHIDGRLIPGRSEHLTPNCDP